MLDALTTGPDPWLAQDKLLHFGGSAFIAFVVEDVKPGYGFLTACTVGAAKELWDRNQPNHTASWRDFAWDVAGAYFGVHFHGLVVTPRSVTYQIEF
jgi:uncharacterized protein YfiM (DUF2279 family)